MKRFHVHLHVDDLARNVDFYSQLFGQLPARVEQDYAKWMLEDPPVNFALSTRGSAQGVDHFGIQADDARELAELKARAVAASMTMLDQGETSCCYSRSEKYWLTDPQGLAWEHFRTLGNIPVYGMSHGEPSEPGESNAQACGLPAASAAGAEQGACCVPAPHSRTRCC